MTSIGNDHTIPSADTRSHRIRFLKWLRKIHGWIGLWGAALGLLFGVTGILQNHRSIMKIPAAHAQETLLQLTLPTPAPANAQAMADWLQHEWAFDQPATRVRSEPSGPVTWGEKTVKQPARWLVSFSTPKVNMQAEYWVGNNFVGIKRNDNNLFATLNNLHKSVGVSAAWVLLADTLAGGMILLSLTGILLWASLNKRRMIGAGIGLTSFALMLVFAMQAII